MVHAAGNGHAHNIAFQTEAQQTTYIRTGLLLSEIFGEDIQASALDPLFRIALGSAVAMVRVLAWGEDETAVNVRAYVVRRPQIDPELLQELLRRNDSCLFGAYGLDDDNDIFFEHTIIGATLDRRQLEASIMAVLTTADHDDDELVTRFGGLRGSDRDQPELPDESLTPGQPEEPKSE